MNLCIQERGKDREPVKKIRLIPLAENRAVIYNWSVCKKGRLNIIGHCFRVWQVGKKGRIFKTFKLKF